MRHSPVSESVLLKEDHSESSPSREQYNKFGLQDGVELWGSSGFPVSLEESNCWYLRRGYDRTKGSGMIRIAYCQRVGTVKSD